MDIHGLRKGLDLAKSERDRQQNNSIIEVRSWFQNHTGKFIKELLHKSHKHKSKHKSRETLWYRGFKVV